MNETLRIPASVLPDIREAVLSSMESAVEAFAEPLTLPDRERHPEWFMGGRERLEHLWGLLDLIGWRETDEERGIPVGLSEYGQTVLNAALPHAEHYPVWEGDAGANDAARVARGEDPRKAEVVRRGAALREFIATLAEQLRDAA